jgi:periplasmic divalent cation tolerance protein
MMQICLVLCNCPDAQTAETIAYRLVHDRLAACVNILPQVKSIYRWQDMVEAAQEHTLLIKTTTLVYPSLQSVITELHPYEVPEIIAIPFTQGLPAYLDWINENTAP